MQLEVGEVGGPHQCGQVVNEAIVHPAIVAFAPHPRRFHPVRPVGWAIFFVKKHAADAVGITLHGERAASQMRQQDGSDAHVIVDHLSLGESGLGIQHLIEIRKLQVSAFDVDHRFFRHQFLVCV